MAFVSILSSQRFSFLLEYISSWFVGLMKMLELFLMKMMMFWLVWTSPHLLQESWLLLSWIFSWLLVLVEHPPRHHQSASSCLEMMMAWLALIGQFQETLRSHWLIDLVLAPHSPLISHWDLVSRSWQTWEVVLSLSWQLESGRQFPPPVLAVESVTEQSPRPQVGHWCCASWCEEFSWAWLLWWDLHQVLNSDQRILQPRTVFLISWLK